LILFSVNTFPVQLREIAFGFLKNRLFTPIPFRYLYLDKDLQVHNYWRPKLIPDFSH